MRFRGTYREDAWRRCAEMSAGDGVRFTPWSRTDAFPHWSLPALEAAKCAAKQGEEVFERVHLSLFEAFFTRSRDIADPREVVSLIEECGVDMARFVADYRSGIGREAVVSDYEAALAEGVRSIPTVVVADTGRSLVGLAELHQYRAAVEEVAR